MNYLNNPVKFVEAATRGAIRPEELAQKLREGHAAVKAAASKPSVSSQGGGQ